MKKTGILLIFFLFLFGCNSTPTNHTTSQSTIEDIDSSEVFFNSDLFFNISDTYDPFIYVEEAIVIEKLYINKIEKDISHLHFESHYIYFNQNLLKALEPGLLEVYVLTNLGYIQIDLELVDNNQPYIITDKNVTYIYNEDVKFLIETFGKGISSISADGNIDEDSYHFEGNQLLIKHDYINQKISDNPERTNIIIIITINYNNNTFISFLNIIIED
ncbi:MAG: hypothetical protein WC152_07050 [Candidatus Izemoplasmatales bacterium]